MLELIKTHLPAENCIDSYNMEPTLYVGGLQNELELKWQQGWLWKRKKRAESR